MTKITFFYVQSVCIIFLAGLLWASPGLAASEPSVQTMLADSTVAVGDEFYLSVLLNLDEALSSGGYINLTYDPNVLECVETQNLNLFGSSGAQTVSCPNNGTLRVISTTASLAGVITFSSVETYAVVTFKAKQIVDSTAVQFAETSQIFGTGGGNILTSRDDNATRYIRIEAETNQPPDPVYTPTPTPGPGVPGPGGGTPDIPVAVPEPSTWLLLVFGLGGGMLLMRRKRE